MYEAPTGYDTVFRTRQQNECLESRLVLHAAGISAEAVHRDGWWLLVVSSADRAVSAAELEAYRQENLVRSNHRHTAVPIYDGAVAAVLGYSGIIILVALLSDQSAFGVDWLAAGRMRAGSVMAGQWWRTVTALTLHLDAGHLISNLAFGTVFGFLAGQVLGGGVAWLAIVIAGALGNFMNAAVQAPNHSSIGASTAVFAALGVVVAHALRHWRSVPEKPLRRWSPLIGGVLLLAFTGLGGEHTDVVAHVTGFLAGLVIGWLGCRVPHEWLRSNAVQKSAGFVTVALVATAWIVGLVAAS